MTPRSLGPALLLAMAACAGAPGPAEGPRAAPQESAALVAVANSLFAAMEARDTAAVRAHFLPAARLWVVGTGEGGEVTARSRDVSEFVASVGRASDPLRERLGAPVTAEVDGALATLWAPYDFHLGTRFSHCGTDAFQFVRLDGAWRIAALSYTIQRTGCEPLRTR